MNHTDNLGLGKLDHLFFPSRFDFVFSNTAQFFFGNPDMKLKAKNLMQYYDVQLCHRDWYARIILETNWKANSRPTRNLIVGIMLPRDNIAVSHQRKEYWNLRLLRFF